ncbi:MAG: P2 family phage major capsid protein [Saezia sp.]
MVNPELTTGWVCIASSGVTVTEREIKAEWLTEMAATYNPDYYTATMWPEHKRSEAMGHVKALKVAVENGVTKLFAILKPTLSLIEKNKAGQLCFCSIEPQPDFAKTGKTYLFGLGLTDTPDSTGTTALKFSAQDAAPRGVSIKWAGNNVEQKSDAFFSTLAQETKALSQSLKSAQATLADMAKQFSTANPITSEYSKMDIHAIAANFSFSFATKERGYLDPIASAALMSALVQSSPLLSRITFVHVNEPSAAQFDGLKPGLRTGRRIGERFGVKANASCALPVMVDMDSGTEFSWSELSQITAGMTQEQVNKALEALMMVAVTEDILRIGFHGITAADETDPAAWPNGEDVAPGWHQAAKEADNTGVRVLLDPVTFDVKGGGDYADLDTMAYHLVDKLPEAYRNDPRLVVLVGGELLRAHKKAYIKPGQIRDKDQHMKIADMPVVSNQNMPNNYFAVTFIENLRVTTVNNTERAIGLDVDERKVWAMRYYRHSGYSLGEPKAYTAFDIVSITK